jgi:hypothetical protein
VTTDVRSGWIGDSSKKLCRHITKLEQMTELLKAMQEMMETQIGCLASRMDIYQAEILAKMESKTDVNLKEMKEATERK